MTLDELRALNPGRDDLTIETVEGISVVRFRHQPPPRLVMLEADADSVSGHAYRALQIEIARLRTAIEYEVTTGLWAVCGYDAFAAGDIPAVIARLEAALDEAAR